MRCRVLSEPSAPSNGKEGGEAADPEEQQSSEPAGTEGPERPHERGGGIADTSAQVEHDPDTLIGKLVRAMEEDGVTNEEAFSASACSHGGLSLFDLQAVVVRARIKTTRGEVEELHRTMDTRGCGRVSREEWSQSLAIRESSAAAVSQDDAPSVLSVDLGAQGDGKVERTREQRLSRCVWVLAVALKMQCWEQLQACALLDDSKHEFPHTDLALVVEAGALDVSFEDLVLVPSSISHTPSACSGFSPTDTDFAHASLQNILVEHLSPQGTQVSRERWKAALKAEEQDVQSILRVMNLVASSLQWDVRTIYNAFPSKAASPEEGGTRSLLTDFVTRGDLVDMNDSWQFCLSNAEIDRWLRYMDSAHSGKIRASSWVAALAPFYAAITAMSCCLHGLVSSGNTSADALFASFDEDKDGKLTPQELIDSIASKLPNHNYPIDHVRVFHKHLTYFTSESEDPSVFPCHWQAAFDLIRCDVVSQMGQVPYHELLVNVRSAIASEQLAALSLRVGYDNSASVLEMLHAVPNSDSANEPALLKLIDSNAALEDLQWELMSKYGPEVMPNLMSVMKDIRPADLRTRVEKAILGVRDKMAVRGTQLLAVLLASHKLSIDVAYVAFAGQHLEGIQFGRFREILRRLAPDFGAASPRIESLFLCLTPDTVERDVRKAEICKEKWQNVLAQEADKLSNKYFRAILLEKGASASASGSQASEQQATDSNALLQGERQRLRDIFFSRNESVHGADAAQENLVNKSRLFISKDQLKLGLARMGVKCLCSIFSVGNCSSRHSMRVRQSCRAGFVRNSGCQFWSTSLPPMIVSYPHRASQPASSA